MDYTKFSSTTQAPNNKFSLDLGNLQKLSIGLFFSDNECTTYMKNGIRIHKPPLFGFWANTAGGYRKTVEFVTPNGTITDQFYGSCNDFNSWLLGKAGRGERFYIIGYPHDDSLPEVCLITEAKVWLGSPHEHHPWSEAILEQRSDLTWGLQEKKETGND